MSVCLFLFVCVCACREHKFKPDRKPVERGKNKLLVLCCVLQSLKHLMFCYSSAVWYSLSSIKCFPGPDAGLCDGPDGQPDALLSGERRAWTHLPLVRDQEGHPGSANTTFGGGRQQLYYTLEIYAHSCAICKRCKHT